MHLFKVASLRFILWQDVHTGIYRTTVCHPLTSVGICRGIRRLWDHMRERNKQFWSIKSLFIAERVMWYIQLNITCPLCQLYFVKGNTIYGVTDQHLLCFSLGEKYCLTLGERHSPAGSNRWYQLPCTRSPAWVWILSVLAQASLLVWHACSRWFPGRPGIWVWQVCFPVWKE